MPADRLCLYQAKTISLDAVFGRPGLTCRRVGLCVTDRRNETYSHPAIHIAGIKGNCSRRYANGNEEKGNRNRD